MTIIKTPIISCKSTVTLERESVVPLPSCPSWRSCLVMQVSLPTETSVFLSSWGESTKFPVLVNRIADPINPWVIADCIVGSINQDNFKVLISGVLQRWNYKASKLWKDFNKASIIHKDNLEKNIFTEGTTKKYYILSKNISIQTIK